MVETDSQTRFMLGCHLRDNERVELGNFGNLRVRELDSAQILLRRQTVVVVPESFDDLLGLNLSGPIGTAAAVLERIEDL